MPDMKRFVTYLYYYEHSTKLHIAGFAKVEVRDGQCRLEIHLKAAGIAGRTIPIYLFAREGDIIQAVEIGYMTMGALTGDYSGFFEADRIAHSSYNMPDIRGMLLMTDDKNMFASQWDDEDITREQIRIYKPSPAVEESQEPKQQEVSEDSAPLHAEELPMRNVITPDFTVKKTLWDSWEEMTRKKTMLRPFEGKEILCVHMELRDIRELPRKYWNLSSNSYLLRGFFQYKYLLLGELEKEDGRELFIGVPGVYERQEKVIASIFGFSEFVSEKKEDAEDGQFGCWCHFIGE